jgi:hypothetical protein
MCSPALTLADRTAEKAAVSTRKALQSRAVAIQNDFQWQWHITTKSLQRPTTIAAK